MCFLSISILKFYKWGKRRNVIFIKDFALTLALKVQ